jgi:membrane-anchored protein YejM (alkaline phosphatase superfamily)
MQTGVVAGADYILSDATTRNLDLLQRSSAFNADRWLAQMEDAVASGMQQANGFLLYGELAPLAQEDMSSSPDAQGDEYQRALLLADQTFGQFIDWLGQQGVLQNTLIALTTSQAQANHTDADNFYGMGVRGQGTSKQTLLAVSGLATCTGSTDNNAYASFVIAPMLMHALGLPAPAEARVEAPGGCL